jgi:hypothetical protein
MHFESEKVTFLCFFLLYCRNLCCERTYYVYKCSFIITSTQECGCGSGTHGFGSGCGSNTQGFKSNPDPDLKPRVPDQNSTTNCRLGSALRKNTAPCEVLNPTRIRIRSLGFRIGSVYGTQGFGSGSGLDLKPHMAPYFFVFETLSASASQTKN